MILYLILLIWIIGFLYYSISFDNDIKDSGISIWGRFAFIICLTIFWPYFFYIDVNSGYCKWKLKQLKNKENLL